MDYKNGGMFRVGDLFDLVNGYAFKGADFIESGVPVIKIKNVKPGKIVLNDLSFVSRRVSDSAQRFKIFQNDILITMSGNRIDGTPETWVGKVAIFKEQGEYLLNQRVGILRPKQGVKVDLDYFAYLLSSYYYQEHFITSANSSGGQANISPSIIYDTEIEIPPLPTQRRIAAILTALDDKIELNRRMNETLEGIAQAVWGEWFGKYAHGEEELPEGWRWGTVGELFLLQRGFDLPTHARTDGIFPVISASGFHGYHSKFMVEAPGLTTGRSGVIGKVFYIQENFWPLNTSLFVKEFKHSTPIFSYFLLKSLDLVSLNGGSAVPTLNRNDVHNIESALPPKGKIEKFEQIAIPHFQLIFKNEIQSRTLAALRDALLPRLMRGEVKI